MRSTPPGTAVKAPWAGGFTRRRLVELCGLVLVALVAALALALTSYDVRDPSFNAALEGAPRNLLGAPGAWTADFFLQTIGLAAWLIAPVLAAWAWRLVSHRGLGRAWLRVTVLPGVLICGAVLFATLPTPSGWPLHTGGGGALGDLMLVDLLNALGHLVGYETAVIGLAAALPTLAALVGAMGLDRAEWRAVGALPCRCAVALWRLAAPVRRLRMPARARAVRKEGRPRKAPPSRGVAEPPPRKAPPSRAVAEPTPVVAPTPPAGFARPARPERAPRQARLDFDGTGAGQALPPTELLDPVLDRPREPAVDTQALQGNAGLLVSVLEDFGVKGAITRVRPGPVVTLYELEPAPGTKSSRVIGLADDVARSMSAVSVRVAVVPGRSVIGIELPNRARETVALRELLESTAYERASGQLTLVLGKDIGGTPVLVDLARMPHLLIAGTTGSGKSVAINTMILSLLYRLTPEQCRVIMIDPKMLELSVYDGIPHLLAPVVTDAGKAVVALRWVVREMENRYRAMSNLGVRNIGGYNARLAEAAQTGETLSRSVQTGVDADTGAPICEEQPIEKAPLPYIVVVVDEMADLMLVAGKEVETAVQRLSQMARAAGIHLLMATQRPSVDVITGTIKANFPTRVSFQVTSKIDSRTILGESGAEQLLGQGDMLYMAGGGRISRVHGPFVSDEEVERVVGFLRARGEPTYVEEVTDPEDDTPVLGEVAAGNGRDGEGLYDQAVALVAREGRASTSFVQRHLQIGYNRAARLIERMEAEGVISPPNHVGKRQVLARKLDQEAG